MYVVVFTTTTLFILKARRNSDAGLSCVEDFSTWSESPSKENQRGCSIWKLRGGTEARYCSGEKVTFENQQVNSLILESAFVTVWLITNARIKVWSINISTFHAVCQTFAVFRLIIIENPVDLDQGYPNPVLEGLKLAQFSVLLGRGKKISGSFLFKHWE